MVLGVSSGCDVTHHQNESKQLDRLAAQRHLYTLSKRFLAAQMTASLLSPIAWPLLTIYCPGAKLLGIVYALLFTLLDVTFLDPHRKQLQEQAAVVQEMFDTDVLCIEWNGLKVPRRADPETIIENAAADLKRYPEHKWLSNWYPKSVGRLPLPLARVVCVRVNGWWDARLRRRVAVAYLTLLLVLSGVAIWIGVAGKFKVEEWLLAVIGPGQATVFWLLRECMRQGAAARENDRRRGYAETLWDRALRGEVGREDLDREARRLQDETFEHRRGNAQVFDWLHKWMRPKLQKTMEEVAEEKVREAEMAIAAGTVRL